MGKRGNDGKGGDSQKKKKFKVASGFLDPGTSGIYASCSRRKEHQAAQELGIFLEEKMEEYYKDEIEQLNKKTEDGADKFEKEDEKEEELSIEDQLNKELAEMKKSDKSKTKDERKKDILKFIDLNCECIIFCKTRRPIVPEDFVERIMKDLSDPDDKMKRTRYVQKLTPITNSCSASMEQLIKLTDEVLAPHFHTEAGRHDYKFAVEVSRRNFNTLERMDIINQVVSQVGKAGKYQHKVDLKNYDKLILVECFKNNIGMSVVNGDYAKKYKKYNIQKIFEDKGNKASPIGETKK